MKRGKSRIAVAVLLCIAMINSVLFGSAAVFAESGDAESASKAQVSSKIEDYLYDSQILTGSGEAYNPENSMKPSDSFSVKLMFSEISSGKNARQFPDDGVMTYQIPTDVITGFEAVKDLPIKEIASGNKIGTYSINASGLIMVDLNDEYVQRYRNIEAYLTFEGSFSQKVQEGGSTAEINFSDSVSITVKLEEKTKLEISKESGSYNYEENTLGYTIKVKAEYGAKNVTVTDTMSELLAMTGGTQGKPLTVKDSKGNAVPYSILDAGDATWKINVGDMAAGEVYTIAYTAKVTDKAFAGIAADRNASYNLNPKNTVTAEADNADKVTANNQPSIRFQRIDKTYSEQNGKLTWTVVINADKYLDLGGVTVTDTMESGLVLDKSSNITIAKNEEAATKLDWKDVSSLDSQWSYTFPKDAGKNTYTFTYKTNIPEVTGIAQNGATESFKNKVALRMSSDIIYTGDKAYQKTGNRFYKHKFRTVYGADKGSNLKIDSEGNVYIRWTSVIRVPSTGLKNFIFEDYILNKTGAQHEFPTGLQVVKKTPSTGDAYNTINVEATSGVNLSGVDIKLASGVSDATKGKHSKEGIKDGFTLYFNTNIADKSKSFLPAAGKAYDVRITGYTKVIGTENGARRNNARITSGTASDFDYEDYSINMKMTGSKAKAQFADGKILWNVKFNGHYASMEEGDVIVKDTFSDNQEFDDNYTVVLTENGTSMNRTIKVTKDTSDKKNCTYRFNLGKLDNNKQYVLKYQTKVKSDVFTASGIKTFKNTAWISIDGEEKLEVKNSFDVNNDIVSKKITTQPERKNQYKAGFTIQVNPNGALLNSNSAAEPEDYVIADTYSKTMAIDLDSISIIRDDAEKLKNDEYTVAIDTSGKENKLEIRIPKADGHKYTIKYNAAIQGEIGETIEYSNTAKLTVNKEIDEGDVSDKVLIKEQASDAGASGSLLNINVHKRDRANSLKSLQGAEFQLYKDQVSEKNLLGTEVTGADGIAVFGQDTNGKTNLTSEGKDYYLEAGVKYILKESAAPDGYALDSSETVFQIRDKGTALLDPEKIDPYNMGAIIDRFNDKYNFNLKKIASETGNALSGAEFTLYTDKECKGDGTTVTGNKDGIFTFKGLKPGTYYLKETKVPKGYYDSGKVYKVEIDRNGDAAIDGEAVNSQDRTYEITNTLAGSIRVTKEVKEDGVGVNSYETFYTALFSDSDLKDRVSQVKALEMNGNQSSTATFDNLKVNETYYVAETDKDGTAYSDQDNSDQWAIAYDNQVVTLDPANLTAESKITNSFYSQYYWAGSIDVTKRVTLDGKDFETNSIFYAGLYTDEDCTQQVGDIKPLVMNGKSSTTVTFSDLSINQTYYVAETDAEGKVITNAQEQLGCKMSIDQNTFTLTEANTEGKAVITNDFHDEEQFYYGGQITINKTTTFKGKAYETNEVFYVALFADQAHKERVTDVKALEMNGKTAAKVSFENLAYGTYYLAETDQSGNALTDLEAAELGFTNVLDEEIKLDVDAAEIELENQMTEEYVTKNGDDADNPKGTATQTGDDSNMTLLILGMLIALTAMGIVLITSRRRKNS
ncbi:LPXTG cell wall anchor domain-containing protein [Hominibacterium faecale]|uniref:LPXTG cell wall anchor domain-containing protein n=1 Tax=Hominibacterium faecale TaxID=2839743 RepID=UPI0022B2AA3D|nr:LPXTG cell wall anchor domain-containing protein [Hominibacterium faecale]